MKLTTLLLFALIMQVSAAGYGQKISLSLRDARLATVFDQISDQTGYGFVFTNSILQHATTVSVHVKNADLKEVLDQVFRNQPLEYTIDHTTVLVKRKASTLTGNQRFVLMDIKGKVVDEYNNPLAGVNVLLKSQNKVLASTNGDGSFSISLPESGGILLFSYIGMESQEVQVQSGMKFINVKMVSKSILASDVVITGYTKTSKKMMTGSTSTLDSTVFANKPFPNVDDIFKGQIPGVVVSAQSGQPGTAQKIRIRGTSTISGDAEPLWVIDGIPLQDNPPNIPSSSEIKSGSLDNIFLTGVAGINPNDIESITVLKDASAAAIYGSRAAGGVIVVTTKRGKAGKMRLNYSSLLTVGTAPQRDAGLMNSAEKIAFEQGLWDEFSAKAFLESKTNPMVKYPVIGITGMVRSGKGQFAGMNAAQQDAELARYAQINENGYDLLFRNSLSNTQHLSLSGGGDKYGYYTSFGYVDNAGLVKKNDYNRYNFKTNLDINPVESVKIKIGIDYYALKSKSPALNRVDPFKYAYFANTYESPYHADGSYRNDETYYSLNQLNDPLSVATKPVIPETGFNIMREMDETSSLTRKNQTLISAGVDVKLSNKFTFESLGSYKFISNTLNEIFGINTKAAFDNRLSLDEYNKKQYASINQTHTNSNEYLLRGQLAYRDQFGKNNSLTAYVGSEMKASDTKGGYSKRYGYDPITGNTNTPLPPPTDNKTIDYDVLQRYLAAIDRASGDLFAENRFVSFYAATELGLHEKYIFNLSFRADGSSYFGNDKQFNPTWAAGFGWHLAEEGFMATLKPILSRATLRLSTGYTGNISKVVSPQLILKYLDQVRNINGNTYRMGDVLSAPNPLLRWEKTYDVKASLDFGLFNDRLNGLFEAYYRKSDDLVTTTQTLSTTGFENQEYNAASLENRGLEFTLSGRPIVTKDFKLNLSVNFNYNLNKVTHFNAPYSSMGRSNIWEGYPLNPVFSGKHTGIDPETGLYLYQLRPDAVINKSTDLNKADNYRYYLGTETAPYTGGFNVGINYKSFALNVGGNYSWGAKSFEYLPPPASYVGARKGTVNQSTQVFQNDLYAQHLNVRKNASNRWTPQNTDAASYPRIWDPFGKQYDFEYYNPMDPDITRGAYLKNLSYLRIRSITLSYNLPAKMLQPIKLSSVAFSLSMNNFFTFTNYDGMDPETPGATYPISRSVSFGVNVGL
ncbi:SusC/RagA family TonB-linked outer membrane protein [Pedobacter caeni]|uniref:TonB-linked outer membrane protein, SusC/RagA family n=1 Tax=Pedobacter caeni TaxID=288992 RepID=A0A1M5L6P5_9SPHI|nr:SusC/RagA family TonB-linked outer membrane protein [Pedobacter caeni]SHG60630.1 TonB-linked outer membrane protein, SusC/RagA family [Pedobacter caeni]